MKKDVEAQDTCLQSIVSSDSLNQAKLSYKIDSDLNIITTFIQKFGEVVVESKPCELSFVRKKDKQAQMMVADLSQSMPVENIQLKLKQKINIKGGRMRGCSLLPDGRMVLSCISTNTVTFMNNDGVELFQIGKDKTGTSTYDTVYIKDNNSVAVSSGEDSNRCIAIIDIESQKVMTSISIDANIFGMAVGGRTLYCSTGDEGIKLLNLSDQSVSDVVCTDVYYVATSGDKLYYTHWNSDIVTCCNLHGTTQWELTDERGLCDSRGISVDNDGNVYVVGGNSNNVVVISPDGQRHRELLSSKDGLIKPRVLDYDRSTNRLLVVNNSKSAYLFDVTMGQ